MVWDKAGKIYADFTVEKCIGWPWWVNILLWFKAPFYFADGVAGHEHYITCKFLFGKCYIIADGKKSHPRGEGDIGK